MTSAEVVLVVEDDEDDFFLVERLLRRHGIEKIFHVNGGQAAIDYLAGREPFADRAKFPRASLVLLDLKLDRVSGHDVLAWVKENLGADRPRIVVLTGSDEMRDRLRVRETGVASAYYVKPLASPQLAAILKPAQPAP